MLDRAQTDERLFAAVRELDEYGHQTFLRQWIEARLGSDPASDWARAIAVAGFLDARDEALELWGGALASPGPGWLATVHAEAATAFERARLSRHGFGAMSHAATEQEAFRAIRLLDRVGDDRVWLFFRTPALRVDPESWRAAWVDFFAGRLKTLRGHFSKSHKKTWLRGARPSDILHNR